MIPDINIKNYYLQFIYNAKFNYNRYNKELLIITNTKNELYEYLNNIKEDIYKIYNINLNSFNKEWINKIYNDSEHLYNKCIKLLQTIIEDKNKIILIQLIKYCNTLRKEYKYKELIELNNKKINIKFSVYRKYIINYYNQVHKYILEGKGYKFGYGIGIYCIEYKKLLNYKYKPKQIIDYAATNARKKELIEKGVKIFNPQEAAWYKARNIPYNAVDYRVFKDTNYYYDILFRNSDISKKTSLQYQHTEYVTAKYRGMKYTEIADKICNKLEDIYNLQVDIKYKLNILLYKYPNKYLNFIRYD